LITSITGPDQVRKLAQSDPVFLT